jgi:hypothetical protein
MCNLDNLEYSEVREMFDAEIELDIDDAIVVEKENLKGRIQEVIKKSLKDAGESDYNNGYNDGKVEALETVLSWL